MHMMLDANKLGALGLMVTDRIEHVLGDLSPSAAALLSMLYFKPRLTGSELAVIAGVSQPTAVRVLEGLVRQGFVERLAQQGRATPLRLTGTGVAHARALQVARLAVLSDLLDGLSFSERTLLETLVDKILAGATTSRAFARTSCRLCEHDLCSAEVCPIGCRAAELETIADQGRKSPNADGL